LDKVVARGFNKTMTNKSIEFFRNLVNAHNFRPNVNNNLKSMENAICCTNKENLTDDAMIKSIEHRLQFLTGICQDVREYESCFPDRGMMFVSEKIPWRPSLGNEYRTIQYEENVIEYEIPVKMTKIKEKFQQNREWSLIYAQTLKRFFTKECGHVGIEIRKDFSTGSHGHKISGFHYFKFHQFDNERQTWKQLYDENDLHSILPEQIKNSKYTQFLSSEIAHIKSMVYPTTIIRAIAGKMDDCSKAKVIYTKKGENEFPILMHMVTANSNESMNALINENPSPIFRQIDFTNVEPKDYLYGHPTLDSIRTLTQFYAVREALKYRYIINLGGQLPQLNSRFNLSNELWTKILAETTIYNFETIGPHSKKNYVEANTPIFIHKRSGAKFLVEITEDHKHIRTCYNIYPLTKSHGHLQCDGLKPITQHVKAFAEDVLVIEQLNDKNNQISIPLNQDTCLLALDSIPYYQQLARWVICVANCRQKQ